MDERPVNPYAPPVESSDVAYQAPTSQGGLSISGQGWEIVTSMAKWMRIVSTFQYILGGLIAVGGLALIALAGSASASRMKLFGMAGGAVLMAGLFIAMAVLFVLGATWLRQAAAQFYDGVLSDAEQPLAHGFRKLRLYLILYGIYGILGLLGNVVELVLIKRLASGIGGL
jgi:hypothetical protein